MLTSFLKKAEEVSEISRETCDVLNNCLKLFTKQDGVSIYISCTQDLLEVRIITSICTGRVQEHDLDGILFLCFNPDLWRIEDIFVNLNHILTLRLNLSSWKRALETWYDDAGYTFEKMLYNVICPNGVQLFSLSHVTRTRGCPMKL